MLYMHFSKFKFLKNLKLFTCDKLFLALVVILSLMYLDSTNAHLISVPSIDLDSPALVPLESTNPLIITLVLSADRGGYGDAATNLMMAERLAFFYQGSNVKINMVIDSESAHNFRYNSNTKGLFEQVYTLWPEAQPEENIWNKKRVNNVTVYEKLSEAPKSDFVVTFSTTSDLASDLADQINGYEKKRFKKGAFYYEYAAQNLEVVGSGSFEKADALSSMGYTGFKDGLYVLDNFRPEDSNKEQTLSALRQFVNGKYQIPEGATLAYAYSSSPVLVQQYINAVSAWSVRNKKPVVVVTNQEVLAPKESASITLINLPRMPFALGQKLIKSADLPVLVTGDSSVSIAVEGAKPFLYSLYAWKFKSQKQLVEQITKRSALIRTNPHYLDLVQRMMSLDLSQSTNYESQFLEYFESIELQTELSRLFSQITKELSLVHFVHSDLSALASYNEERLNYHLGVIEMLKIFRGTIRIDQKIKKAEELILNPKHSPAMRLRYFKGLISFKQYSLKNAGVLLSKILTGSDYALKIEFANFFSAEIHPFSKDIIPHLSHEGRLAYQAIFMNSISQDPRQWGDFRIRHARSMLKILSEESAKSCSLFFK